MGTDGVRGKSGTFPPGPMCEAEGEAASASSVAAPSGSPDQFISQIPPQAPDAKTVSPVASGLLGRSNISAWPPPWVSNPVFQSVDVSPYEELKALIERNGRLLEKYRSFVPETLSSKFELLASRHQQNVEEVQALNQYPDEAHRQDLYDRNQILQRRILDLGRELGENLEMVPGTRVTTPNLNDIPRPPIPPPQPKPPSDEEKTERKKTGVYRALINHRYPGIALTLRDYQRNALRSFEADLSRATHLGESSEDFEGTLVLPTGSGKTRLMSAMMALTVAKGFYVEGDKIIVTTHLKNVTSQNLEAIKKDLAEDFKKKFGRELRVTAVAGSSEDWSGDVVVMSIPKVGRKDFGLIEKLHVALKDHKIPLMIMDEIHHGEAASWKAVKEIIRAINGGKAYVMGLTATPTGSEPNVIYKESPFRLMQAGALPNVYLVEGQTGIHLDGIKRSKGDFNADELQAKINTPQRNRLMIELLEKHGIRNLAGDGLAPTLITAVERQHAWDIAQSYAQHFRKDAREGEDHALRERSMKVIGSEDHEGKIIPQTKAQIEKALQAEARGEIDGLIAVVTGDMKDSARDLILENWKNGNIEAVINVGVYKEGFDGWFVQNLVGGKASLSAIEKGQEAGRITRRGPDEVDTKTGKLLKVIQRVAIDLRDIYAAGYLQTYRESLGYGHRVIPKDTLYDLMNEHPVGIAAPAEPASKSEPISDETEEEKEILLETPRLVLAETLKQLNTLLEQNYRNNLDEMAFDLGLEVEELKRVLSGESPLEAQLNLARRLGTLLYLERESFVNPYFSDLRASTGNERYLAREALMTGLELYLKQENLSLGQELSFLVDTGMETQVHKIKRNKIINLFRGRFLSQGFVPLAQGLVEYFREMNPQASADIVQAMNQAYGGRLEWDKRLAALKGMSWAEIEALDQEVAKLLQKNKPVYLVGSNDATLQRNGSFVGNLRLMAEKPKRGKQQIPPYVQLERSGERVLVTGSEGGYVDQLAQALRDSGLVGWSEEYARQQEIKSKAAKHISLPIKKLEDLKELGKSNPALLLKLAGQQWGEEIPQVFYLVGSNNATLRVRSDGSLSGSLFLMAEKPERIKNRKNPYIQLERSGERLLVTGGEGIHVAQLAQALRDSGLVMWSEEYARQQEIKSKVAEHISLPIEKLEDLKALAKFRPALLFELAKQQWGKEIPPVFYLVGSGNGTLQHDGSLNGSLLLMAEKPERNKYKQIQPYVQLERSGEWVLVTGSEGGNIDQLAQALRDSGLVTWSEEYARQHKYKAETAKHISLPVEKPEDLKELGKSNPALLLNLAGKQWGEEIPPVFYLVGSNTATLRVRSDGSLNGSLHLMAEKPERDKSGGIHPYVQLERSGERLLVTGGEGLHVAQLAQALRDSGLVTWSEEYARQQEIKSKAAEHISLPIKKLEDLKALTKSQPGLLFELAGEQWGEEIPQVFFLVGSNMGTLQRDGRLQGSLRLMAEKPERNKGQIYPYVQLERSGERVLVTKSGGGNVNQLAQALRDSGLVEFAPGFQPEIKLRRPKKGSEGFIVLPDPESVAQFGTRTAVNAVPFAVGEYVSNWFTGHPNPSLKAFAQFYIPLTLIGGASQTTVDSLIRLSEGKTFLPNSLWVKEPSSSFGKALARRTIPLFLTFTLLDALKHGKVDPTQLSLTVGNILAASTVTHTVGASLNKVKLVNRLAQGLRLIKVGSVAGAPETGGVTILGACLASVVEFTLLKLLGNAEQKFVDHLNENKLRTTYAQVIQKNNELLAMAEYGEEIDVGEVIVAQQELFAIQTAYESFLQDKVDRLTQEWGEKRRALEVEEMEQVTQVLDGPWSRTEVRERYAEQRQALAREYTAQIKKLEGEEGDSSLPDWQAGEETWPLQNPQPMLSSFETHRSVTEFSYTQKSLHEENITTQIQTQLPSTLHALQRQYNRYAEDTNEMWSEVLQQMLYAQAKTDEKL